ncbi:MAG TPA: polyphosphate kinase 1 [Vicinamibacterales bacterium]|nr:polyphosphate kinase 1 [Vicinamibacterales bacterium]
MNAHSHDQKLFLNRELSWLAFNERVLEEAVDPSNRLLERVKFVAICSSNLDEFFMVRVAGLKESIDEHSAAADLCGMTPQEQLAAVGARAHQFVARLYDLTVGELLPALAAVGIRLVHVADLSDNQRASLAPFFRDSVLPVLTPLAIDVLRPFPRLSSLSLNIAVLLEATSDDTRRRLAVVQVPPGLQRLVQVATGEGAAFVLLEDLISLHLAQLFPGQRIVEASPIRLSRDAELEFDDEGGRTQLERVERELRRRRLSDVVRLEIEAGASRELVALLCEQVEITEDDVYAVSGPLDLRVLTQVIDLPGYAELRDPPLNPVSLLAGAPADMFTAIDDGDILLHHPYESYDPVVALLDQAADDPDVLAIKQTLYRASPSSAIIAALARAAQRNKQVTVVVELTARFDEERNIRWARSLEEVGAHVIYGIRGYKVHAKICLIVKRTPFGLRRYVHLATGNYNERTARLYTDFGLLTTSAAIAEDASAFFSALTGYSDPPRLKKLTMAPTGLRERFLRLINRERRRAAAGQPAEIMAKMNSLIDHEVIEALYAASREGVIIRLNVRGICALKPGLPGHSETIEVVSVVDRFLEHSRVYWFLNGGEDEIYLASADWMTRNFDKRIELLFPVERSEHKAKVLHALRAMFMDNVKARQLQADGTYQRRAPAPGEEPYRVQQALQDEARRAASLAREGAGVSFVPAQRSAT